jgi:3-(3-hydroxy-phenyl)propionate hydroxylase
VDSPAGAVLLDEMAGAGWRIVTVLALETLPDDLRQQAAMTGTLVSVTVQPFAHTPGAIATQECDGVLASWFDRYQGVAAIVRPDHYVFGVAADAAALAGLLAHLQREVAHQY